ncbi:MAG: T9SS type A sorting domain-containing protein [Ginsengibacter sp.]
MKCLCNLSKRNLLVVQPLNKLFFAILFLCFGLYANTIKSQSRLYLSNDNHTDYMWTADAATYDNAFITMIDTWMANNNATNANAPDYQTKFNFDGTYWAWSYEKQKTAAQFQALMNQVKNERIVIPMNPLIITYGCVPAEATLRGMYYAGELQRKYSIPFDMSMSMENQVLPLGLPSLWKGSGAKYAWHGVCNCSTLVPSLDSSRQKEIYWYKGLDDSSVLMKWYTYDAVNHTLGNYSEARNAVGAINSLTDKVNTTGYNYNIAGAFGVGSDDLETTTDELSAAAQTSTNSTRRVIVSNEVDFFRDFEATYGATLPAITQTYGNEWEHACASLSELSANIKRSLEKLRAAEAMATVVARTDPSFAGSLDSLRKEAWMSLGLYFEHDFGGNGPGVTNDERAAWQRRMEETFTGYVNQLYTLSKANLANQVTKSSSNKRFFVFNPLSWARTDYTDIAYSGTLPVHVMDVTTNTEVRSQAITRDGTQYLRILAAGVPSVGYKVFEIVSGAGSTFTNAATINTGSLTIDNDYYTVVFTNSGVITSLVDKTNGNKELVNSGSNSEYINNISRNSAFEGNSNATGTFVVDNNGPVSLTVKITSTEVVNHETRITVFKDIPRVEIDNKITQNFANDFLYNTFSFNNTSISSPDIWHEENGAVINAKKVKNGGHYANQQARYDWLTLNHFAAVSSNGNYGVTLSNQDCYFMQTGNSTVQDLDENTGRIKVLVAGRVDGAGMANQDNDVVFNQRYAISAYDTYSAVTSMKSSLEHQNAFVSAEISNTTGILPEKNFSFLTISDPNTLLWALKPAEEGMDTNGAIVRVWNLSNAAHGSSFVFNDDITDAKNITHIETDVSTASFADKTLSTSVGKNQMKSYRVKLVASTALPIRLTDFAGLKQNGINKITWRAEEGINFSGYTLERSEDGNNFTELTTVAGTGSGSYSYDDANIDELKPYYYRLKLGEKDGSFFYSTIILVTVDPHTKDFLLYHNPVHNELKFQLILDKQARFDVWINDITGKTLIKSAPPLFEVGNNYFTINTSNLPVGTYVLIVRNAEKKYIRKFIKQ